MKICIFTLYYTKFYKTRSVEMHLVCKYDDWKYFIMHLALVNWVLGIGSLRMELTMFGQEMPPCVDVVSEQVGGDSCQGSYMCDCEIGKNENIQRE